MANRKLFRSASPTVAPVETVNNAGGVAYRMDAKHELAQLVFTGTFNNTFYVGAKDQLDSVLRLAKEVEDEKFLAKLALAAREQGFMKDTPAMLVAILSTRNVALVKVIWKRVINNVRMLRTFVQILRSGVVGRKSFGTSLKTLIKDMLEGLTPSNLFKNSVGNDPSLADIIKMVHPTGQKKGDVVLGNTFAYILGKEYNVKKLPDLIQQFERYKKDKDCPIPDLPFQFLDSLGLDNKGWAHIARTCSWQTLRMNLNTFNRHDVFKDVKMIDFVAEKIQNEELIRKANCFPYQLLVAWKFSEEQIPSKISVALQKAMEIATENVPVFDGKVFVCVDTSGSMSSPVTGDRGSATTKVSCVDVAALIAASILRKNPDAVIVPFDTEVHMVKLNPMDSVVTNATKLALHGGGTACSVALAHINRTRESGSLVIYVSDNESWFDTDRSSYFSSRGTAMAAEWASFKKRNPKSKLICIDLTPNDSLQVKNNPDVLNVGGFSDRVFDVIKSFQTGGNWVDYVEKININSTAKLEIDDTKNEE